MPPQRARRPSGEKATALTQSACPRKRRIGWRVSRSQRIIVLSSEPDRMRRPSGETTTISTTVVAEELGDLGDGGLFAGRAARRQRPDPDGLVA